MATISTSTSDLRTAAPCRIVLPGDDDYPQACQSFNLAVEQRPAAVAYPTCAADAAGLVRGARDAGLRVAVQGGAHNPAPQGTLEEALLIRTTEMTGVEVDPLARRARVEAGVLWESVVDAAAPHGLVALHGSSPDVGVVGYSLGGGLSWLARSRGLQTSRVLAAELVTADGRIVHTDADQDPDLLWALRGGGGNFGVVCALEFELLPLTHVYAGALAWDWVHAERVLQRWATWAADAPEAATTSARLLQMPPLPEIPELLRGRRLVMIDGVVDGTEAEGAAILAPLRDLEPEIDLFATMPAPALVRLHGDPEEPMPYLADQAMLAALPPEAVSAFVAAAGPGSGSTLGVAELRQLGGALGRPDPEHGAVTGFDGAFLLFGCGLAAGPEMGAQSHADARRLTAAMAPWAGGRPYLNFVEEATDASAAFAPEVHRRLREIRRRVDPAGVFRANHEIAR